MRADISLSAQEHGRGINLDHVDGVVSSESDLISYLLNDIQARTGLYACSQL